MFLEIGAGDCAFTLAVADRGARKCYALDVSREILSGVQRSQGRDRALGWLHGARACGCGHAGLQLPGHGTHPSGRCAGTVAQPLHRARARRLVHVRDAEPAQWAARRLEILRSRWRAVFISRNTRTRSSRGLFRAVGFSRVVPYAGFRGHYLRLPLSFVRVFECVFGKLPRADSRSAWARSPFSRMCSRSTCARSSSAHRANASRPHPRPLRRHPHLRSRHSRPRAADRRAYRRGARRPAHPRTGFRAGRWTTTSPSRSVWRRTRLPAPRCRWCC